MPGTLTLEEEEDTASRRTVCCAGLTERQEDTGRAWPLLMVVVSLI